MRPFFDERMDERLSGRRIVYTIIVHVQTLELACPARESCGWSALIMALVVAVAVVVAVAE